MADVSENKPAEQVAEQQPQVAETTVEKPAETTTEKATEAPAEKPAETTSEKTTEASSTEAVKDTDSKPEENNERKRRGSFQRGGDNKRGRNQNRGNYKGNAYNKSEQRQNKSRFENLPESDDAGEIRRQVDFYFSDSNLPIDAYLLKLTGGKENKPVPLKTIHDFKRMRHFQPYSAVRDAVANSKFLNLNEADEITRKVALADKYGDDAQENKKIASSDNMKRSIYVKGFGNETEKSQLEIEEFFEPYGPVTAVRLRRADDGFFKRSVFAEFESEEGAKAFLELDPKPKFNDNELTVMSKQEYVDKKNDDIKEGRINPRSPSRGNQRSNRDGGDNWKSSRDDFQSRGGRGGRGRGGRGRGGDRGGRGRGGRGGGRGGRDGRPGDRNAEREASQKNGDSEAGAESKKRSHDGEGDKQTEAKKVKETAPAAATEA
jgi:lupus La protein